MTKVLDTSALLALLFRETGADVAETAIADDAAMSLVNAAESMIVLQRKGLDAAEARQLVLDVPVSWHAPTADQAAYAADFGQTPGLSLGDSFCLALARDLGASAVTADRAWASLNSPVPVEVIR